RPARGPGEPSGGQRARGRDAAPVESSRDLQAPGPVSITRRAMVLTVLSGALAACATVDRTEDMRIESEVKARLVAEKDANLTRLGVVSSDATVYLSGTVASREQRTRAEALSRGVRGVRRVVNTVEVATPSR